MSRPDRPGRRLHATRRGWTLVGTSVALVAAGFVLGARECSAVGIAGLLLVGVGAAWTAAAAPGLHLERRAAPLRPHVGDAARVDLVVRPARRRWRRAPDRPAGELIETVDEDLRARFVLGDRRGGAPLAYRLPTDRRGPVTVGPATVVRHDPFGLTGRTREVAAPETLLVRPRVHPVAPPRLGAGRRVTPDAPDARRARTPEPAGELLTVRPYEPGDDPRLVHWAATARTDDLMVRQDLAPRPGRVLVVLDVRAPATPDGAAAPGFADAFERAVEAAASVVRALQRDRRPVECATSDGEVLTVTPNDPSPRVLDRLALVRAAGSDLTAVAGPTGRGRPDLVVVVTARADAPIAALLTRWSRLGPTVLVATGGTEVAAPGTVVDARAVPFPEAWAAGFGPGARPGTRIPRDRVHG